MDNRYIIAVQTDYVESTDLQEVGDWEDAMVAFSDWSARVSKWSGRPLEGLAVTVTRHHTPTGDKKLVLQSWLS